MKNKSNIYTITFIILIICTLLMILMGTFSFITLNKHLKNKAVKENRLQESKITAEEGTKKSSASEKMSVFDLNLKN